MKKVGIPIVIVLIITLTGSLIYKNYNFTICKGQSTCMYYEEDTTKIKTMKFDDQTDYNLIALEGKGIDKIEGLQNHDELETLDLAKNNIGKIEGLENLTNLKSLDLSENNIGKIEGLESLTNIDFIYLQDNPIDKIENIEQVKSNKKIVWYLPYEATQISRESYNYIKSNENVEVYFVQAGANVHTAVSDKTIDDLEKV